MTDKLEEHDDIIEIFAEYRKGFYSLKNAIRQLGKMGFEENVAYAMLKSMKREPVTNIRGYARTPERMKKAHDKWRLEVRGCDPLAGDIEPKNKQ